MHQVNIHRISLVHCQTMSSYYYCVPVFLSWLEDLANFKMITFSGTLFVNPLLKSNFFTHSTIIKYIQVSGTPAVMVENEKLRDWFSTEISSKFLLLESIKEFRISLYLSPF